jgi:hypothetical protein
MHNHHGFPCIACCHMHKPVLGTWTPAWVGPGALSDHTSCGTRLLSCLSQQHLNHLLNHQPQLEVPLYQVGLKV